MRRWFAISGLFHAGLLLALILWFAAETTRPSAPSTAVFVSGRVPEAAELADEPEDPREPPEKTLPDAWSESTEVFEAPETNDEWDAADFDSVRLPGKIDLQRLCVRLKRPLRITRHETTPQASQAVPAPNPPALNLPGSGGASRQPAVSGQPPAIRYPRRARRRGLEGTVELRLLVTREGRVDRIEIAETSGHEILDAAARTAVASWRFSPALRNGVTIAAWTRRVIRFRLSPLPPPRAPPP